MGQCEGLHDISYRLLLADSSPSVEAIHSNVGHCKHFLAAILAAYIGPCGSFVQQLIVGSRGQCEGLHDISYRLLLADLSPSVEAIHSKRGPL